MILWAILVLSALVLAVLVILWVGAWGSLDRERQHSSASADLPSLDAAPQAPLVQIPVERWRFRARVAGFGGSSGNLILLHGFPETSAMWLPLIEAAAAKGFQVVAFDQRGYSPGARPPDVASYSLGELVGDVFAVADAVGFDRFHLVGHDWGAAVGWTLVTQRPERVLSWTALSIPHLASYAHAVRTNPEQRRRSSYVLLFRTPWLPEQLLAFADFRLMRAAMYREHAATRVDEYIRVFAEPGALTAALNWYRAQEISDSKTPNLEVGLPTLYVWGNEDPVVTRSAVEDHRRYMVGAYREVELDTGHWLMESATAPVVRAVLEHLERH